MPLSSLLGETYSVACQEWFTNGMCARGYPPTICAQRCSAPHDLAPAWYGKVGHEGLRAVAARVMNLDRWLIVSEAQRGSNETTLTRVLQTELGALRLTADEWHRLLYGQDATHPEHDERQENQSVASTLSFRKSLGLTASIGSSAAGDELDRSLTRRPGALA